MVQEAQIIQTISQILNEGRIAAEMALTSDQQRTAAASMPSHVRLHPVASNEVAAAVEVCLSRLEQFLLACGGYQDMRVTKTVKRHVTAFIHECVASCAAAAPNASSWCSQAMNPGYSQIEQLQDKFEAQADIMFYRLAIQRVQLRKDVYHHT
jgi:hypothetical protein